MQFLKLALKIAGSGIIIIALAVLSVSFSTFCHTQKFLKSASRTQGTIVKLDDEGREAYPVVMFHDSRGQEHEIESTAGQNPPAYRIGEAVTVLYQPDKPENAKLNTFFDIWGWTIMLVGFGVIVFVSGSVMLLVGVKMEVSAGKVLVDQNHPSNVLREATLEVSYSKALLYSAVHMAFFVIALFVIGMPMHDPLLIGFLVVMVPSMSFVFGACFCFMLRCKISHDGLCPAVPMFYQRVLRWGDVAGVRTTLIGPFHVVRGRALGEFCILPRRFFLKHPESLKQLLQEYAPADNIVRRELAG
jgi:hypothetical protein